jgi:hypothetical protein
MTIPSLESSSCKVSQYSREQHGSRAKPPGLEPQVPNVTLGQVTTSLGFLWKRGILGCFAAGAQGPSEWVCMKNVGQDRAGVVGAFDSIVASLPHIIHKAGPCTSSY